VNINPKIFTCNRDKGGSGFAQNAAHHNAAKLFGMADMTKAHRCLIRLTLLSGIASFSAPVAAMVPDVTTSPERWSFLITYGDENCPAPSDDEIIVCAERPESERFRIPEPVRVKKPPPHTGDQSLTAATETLDGFARLSRPGSCSAVGSGGFSGCTAAALRQWFAERREAGIE
jgi:hypothetical protein